MARGRGWLHAPRVTATSTIQQVNELRARLARGDVEGVVEGLEALPADLPPALRRRVADLWASLERWDAAISTLEPLAGQDLRTELRLNYVRNMGALMASRPGLYGRLRVLEDDPGQRGRFRVDDQMRICARVAEGFVPLCSDPIARAEGQWPAVIEMVEQFGTVGLVGVGDGYLAAALSCTDFGLPNGMTQPVIVIEPDLGLLKMVLELHDFSQPEGLIHDARGLWCVGADWYEALHDLLVVRADVHLPRSFLIGSASQAVQARVLEVIEAYQRDNAAVEARLHARDEARTADELVALLGPDAPRAPRAFLVTSRFTRVLRHATDNLARSLRELGWEASVLTEGEAWQRLPRLKIRRALEAADPDAVVIVNHARPEYGSVYPPNLPFVTWVQDQMPNLERVEVGEAIGPRDFVMTGMDALVERFAYPPRQVARMRCLTRIRSGRPAAIAPAHDLVYVSHCSLQRPQLLEQFNTRVRAGELDPQRAARALAAVEEVYAAGGALPTSRAVMEHLADAIALDLDDRAEVANWVGLVSFANIVLYRQQALRWVADVARSRGLDLAIYGLGWERWPEFAAHAKGAVAYGEPLDAVVRAASFSLVLEPFPITSHWRGLDCMANGGLPLVRRHPYHGALEELARWVDARGVSDVGDVAEARQAAVREDERRELDRILEGCSYLGLLDDPLRVVQSLRAEEASHLGVPPGVDAVSFDGPAELGRRLDLLADPGARAKLAAQMRGFVETHFSYRAGVSHLLSFMRRRISDEPSLDGQLGATARAS